MQLNIYFPKQKKDYKIASRFIRRNKVFGSLVTSHQDRELNLTFKSDEQRDILVNVLSNVLESMGYIFELKE